ncbi:hypothetical protein ABZY81_18530 [Streptomyces sp. NPDC006514]|uniref:hypothetical protein n=1 Tax=Streptomyces sp. NPDC006514 TaxID=3154308 RepID=UPI0033BD049C
MPATSRWSVRPRAGRRDLVSRCYEQLGDHRAALAACPAEEPDRLASLAAACRPDIDHQVQRGDRIAALGLVSNIIGQLERAARPTERVAGATAELQGFRAPVIAPDREHLTSAEECAALPRLLREAPVALHGLVPEPDRLDPARSRVVPAGFRTDGLWVWSDQIAYYLERYRCAPQRPDVPARLLSAAGKLVRGEPRGSLTGRPATDAR